MSLNSLSVDQNNLPPLNCLCVLGTRPEVIKLVPLVRRLKQTPGMDVQVCVTAQHREMLDQMLQQFGLVPDIDLNLMRKDQSLASLTAAILSELDSVLMQKQRDLVIVQGDTTTTFAASLAAFYRQIPVAHVEAGLRTGNIQHPFPEEMNRLLTSQMTRWHFAPTESARQRLLNEGISKDAIRVTGNTGIDTLLSSTERMQQEPDLIAPFIQRYPQFSSGRPLVLVTGHRRENFGQGLAAICDALAQLAGCYPDYHWVYPVHLNPAVQQPVKQRLGNLPNVHLLPPLDYFPFVYLMQTCRFILTDSGGIQEEAPVLGKPVLVMRETSERQEAIDSGSVKLVGRDADSIVKHAAALIDDFQIYEDMARPQSPYGDGLASKRIVACLDEWRLQKPR